MQTHQSCRLVAIIASFAITIPCAAQQDLAQSARSMQFELRYPDGNTFLVTLQEADFTDPENDRILKFVGEFCGIEGDAFELNLGVSFSIIAAITSDCITAIDMGDTLLGVSKDAGWIGLSEQESHGDVKGVTIHTNAVSTGEISTLRVTGDYTDLFQHFGTPERINEAEIFIAQALAVITSGSAASCKIFRH